MDWETYRSDMQEALENFEFGNGIVIRLKQSRRIFIAGNGGSAATAMHYACDFMKFGGLNIICLNTDMSQITAIANDYDYKDIFKKQLENFNINSKDILILISVSGNSPNIIEAAKYAKNKGLKIIGISGFTGGKLKKLSDYSAHIEGYDYGICENIHLIFGHYLTEQLKKGKE